MMASDVALTSSPPETYRMVDKSMVCDKKLWETKNKYWWGSFHLD